MNHALALAGGRTFASVRKHRNYRLYFTGQAISFTGTWMQQIAAAWLVLQLTSSAVAAARSRSSASSRSAWPRSGSHG